MEVNKGKLQEASRAMALALQKMKTDSLLLQRQKALWEVNVGTRVELEQRELAYENARVAYFAAREHHHDLVRQLAFASAQSNQNLRISQTLVNEYSIRSEIDGVVYLMSCTRGEFVGPQAPLAVIGSATEFILEMQIDEYDILRIQMDQLVLITMDSYKGKIFEARIARISPIMNERTRTFLVEAEFVSGPPKLYPHLTFEANIILQKRDDVLLIPRTFLLRDSIVQLVTGEQVAVKTGLRDYNYVEVITGITEQDVLVKPEQ